MSRPRNPLARLGLKFNPFSHQIPVSGCRLTPRVEHFCRRVEYLSRAGGFALVVGPVGAGKSVILRQIVQHLSTVPDIRVGELTRPHGSVHDFYRELGDIFGVDLSPSNRWGGARALRERWQTHIDASLYSPVLLVDEAQEMKPAVLGELRLLTSAKLDSQWLLTVLLAGDERLPKKLQSPALLPLESRIRVKLILEQAPVEELALHLRHVLDEAGNPTLMTTELIGAIADHSAGNLRSMMNTAHNLLELAIDADLKQLDEQHLLELAGLMTAAPASANRKRRR